MSLNMIWEQILNGLILGSMYAFYGCGLTLIWGTLQMLNFAHGEFYMLGGYIFYFALTLLGAPPVLGILIAIGGVFLIGFAIERFFIHYLLDKPGWEVSPVVLTLGVSIFLQNFALKAWGERYKSIPYFIEGTLEVFGFRIAYQRLLILVVAVIVMGIFWFFLKRTRLGMALRATSQNREASSLVGINIHRVYGITFGIGGALAALSATMLAPIFLINPWMGLPSLMKAFAVSVMGGLGSLEGAILAGVILGIGESLAVPFLSSEWKEIVSFGILILVLIIRPSGFFGVKEL
jgi:branched-chain amino acid transport system permease protein